MNEIVNFKGRQINQEEPVFIYRNLNKKGTWYSLKQKSRVVAHATLLNLKNCEFIVNEKARDKIRRTGKKYPHAYIKGIINNEMIEVQNPIRVVYNPMKYDHFINPETGNKLTQSPSTICNENGVWIRG